MICISKTYEPKWAIKGVPEYQFAEKKLFNIQRGKEVKKCLSGYTLGYNIRGKFYSLTAIKKMIERIEKIDCPF